MYRINVYSELIICLVLILLSIQRTEFVYVRMREIERDREKKKEKQGIVQCFLEIEGLGIEINGLLRKRKKNIQIAHTAAAVTAAAISS